MYTCCININICTLLLLEKPCKIMNVTGKVIVDKNDVTIVFSADDSLASFQCRLDNKKFSFCKFTYLTMQLYTLLAYNWPLYHRVYKDQIYQPMAAMV